MDTSVSVNDTSLSANLTGASYQWLDCDKGFAVIPGETGRVFIPSQNGNYAVELNKDNCTDTSACQTFVRVGMEVLNSTQEILLYPNPANEIITIEFEKAPSDGQVKIRDLSGKLIRTEFIGNAKKSLINMPEAQGIYIIQIISQGEITTLQVIRM